MIQQKLVARVARDLDPCLNDLEKCCKASSNGHLFHTGHNVGTSLADARRPMVPDHLSDYWSEPV